MTFACSGTITMTNSPLTIDFSGPPTSGITIDGTGQNITLSGNNTTQILNIFANIPAGITLNNLTFANGSAPQGGAIFAEGVTLTVNNSTFFQQHRS